MKQRIRHLWRKLSRLEGRPHQIAFGFTIGVVAGLLPLNPSPILVATVAAWLLNRSVVPAVAGASTAILYIPLLPLIWLAEYRLGTLLLPADLAPNFEQAGLWEVLQVGWDVFAAMFVGSIIISAPVAVLTYFVVKRLAARWARQKNRVATLRPIAGSDPAKANRLAASHVPPRQGRPRSSWPD